MKKLIYSWEEYNIDIKDIIKGLHTNKLKFSAIYGIPKGGLVLATTLANKLNIPLYLSLNSIPKSISKKNILIVDDVSDSGLTLLRIPGIEKYSTLTLFYKPQTSFIPDYTCRKCDNKLWIVYPWE